MKYGIWIPIVVCVIFWTIIVSICLGQTVDDKVKELISTEKGIAIEDVDTTLATNAVTISKNIVIDEIKERIRRQKVDEAKKYNPTDKEITDYLQAKIDALKNAKEVTIP